MYAILPISGIFFRQHEKRYIAKSRMIKMKKPLSFKKKKNYTIIVSPNRLLVK